MICYCLFFDWHIGFMIAIGYQLILNCLFHSKLLGHTSIADFDVCINLWLLKDIKQSLLFLSTEKLGWFFFNDALQFHIMRGYSAYFR